MFNKVAYGLLGLSVVGFLAYAVFDKKEEAPRPGVAQTDNGGEHVASKQYGGTTPPTSGDHAAAVPWDSYDQEVPDANAIHNLEHGGIYVSYRPDLPTDQIAQLKALLFEPFSNEDFKPTKVVLAPRAANAAPIVVSSWARNMTLEQVDTARIQEYYLANFGKSPEPSAP